jgi:hypothetical protein
MVAVEEQDILQTVVEVLQVEGDKLAFLGLGQVPVEVGLVKVGLVIVGEAEILLVREVRVQILLRVCFY